MNHRLFRIWQYLCHFKFSTFYPLNVVKLWFTLCFRFKNTAQWCLKKKSYRMKPIFNLVGTLAHICLKMKSSPKLFRSNELLWGQPRQLQEWNNVQFLFGIILLYNRNINLQNFKPFLLYCIFKFKLLNHPPSVYLYKYLQPFSLDIVYFLIPRFYNELILNQWRFLIYYITWEHYRPIFQCLVSF